jgi:uncharacterized iron-regulated membrane protein
MGKEGMTAWQKWLERPDKLWVRNMFFQVHFWIGAAAGAYILLMSVSGSVIVYRNELSGNSFVEWVVRLHENLLSGTTGRFVNGIGAVCLTLLCLTGAVIWWPGTKHWRRSLTVDWSAHFADQLGRAQRARLLVFYLCNGVGNLGNLFCVPASI